MTQKARYEISYSGYLVNEINVMADKAVTYAWICTNQNSTLGSNVATALPHFYPYSRHNFT